MKPVAKLVRRPSKAVANSTDRNATALEGRRTTVRFAFAVAVIAGCCLASTATAQRSDQVFPVRGSALSGVISEIAKTHVTINVRGTDQKVEVIDIKRVTFSEDPPELSRSRDNILNGQLENGLAELKRIDPANIQREFVKQDLAYFIAYSQAKLALTGGGDKAAARQALLSFVGSAKDSFHFFEAAQLLGDLAVALESYEDAVKYYGAIAKLAPWPEYQLRSAVLEARALEAQGKYPESIAKYETVIGNAVDTAEATRQKSFAKVGKAVGLAETGQAEEGVKLLDEIIAKNDPQDGELFGRTYNALGRCHLKANRPKDALLAFLHVDVLFYSQPDVHAEALYHLTKLWQQVNKSDRAVVARSLLNERYAGSPWSKRS
jgi:tetratricopeptide (TPR) repeat protein